MKPIEVLKDVVDGGGISLTTKLHLVAYSALLGGCVLLTHFWMQEAIGRARAESTSQAEQGFQKRLESAIEAREKAFGERLDALKAENEKIRSQKQAVQYVTKVLPAAAPAEIKREDLKPEVSAKLPDSPGFTLRTEPQEIALAKELNACQQDRLGKSKCEADIADVRAQLESVQREREAWKKASKGGFWRKTWSAVKWIAIGAGAGIAISQR